MSTPEYTPVTDLTAEEVAESVNGWDEIAVANKFGVDIYDMPDTKAARALCFIIYRRQGQKDAEAFTSALDLTVKQVTEFFTPEPDEVTPEEPTSEPGKDD